MSVVDLHPEELLDKHARGVLSEIERARLEAHVSSCVVCRFELAARVAFEDADDESVVAPPLVNAPAPAELETSPRPRARRTRGWVVGLAAALIGGVSFAAISAELIARQHGAPARPVAPPRSNAVATSVAAAATLIEPEETSVAEQPVTPSVEGRPREAAPVHAARAGMAPSELFRAANAARRNDDTERAIGLYRELEARYPKSDEARVSYATVASLQLDKGDPRSALDGFNRYLSRGDGALGEEALVGRALSFQRLGQRDREVAAWQDVLRRFPSSVHARVARARLVELGQR